MSYKTILLHLNHEPRARAVLGVGIDLATRFEAHLIGCHVFPSYRLTPPVPLPFATELAAQIKGAIKKEADGLEGIFDEMTATQPFVSEWRSITSQHRDPAATVLEQAHAADIVVAAQPDPAWQFSEILDFPERLALGAGRPVLVVPNFGQHRGVPKTVMIAWNQRRESARAVWDALPLLQCAERVVVMTIMEGSQRSEAKALDTDIAAALARHGVKVEAAKTWATEYTVGEEIRVRALEQNADLVVLGCYGHSRLREYALGGVTRHMLRETTTPILFSH